MYIVLEGHKLNDIKLNFKKNFKITPLSVQYCTDKGMIRPHNEDSYGYFIPNDDTLRKKFGSLFVISDGVGGSAAGEVASAEAVNVLLQEYYFGNYSEHIPERLKGAFEHTAMHIYELSSARNTALLGMKCTLSAILIKEDKFYIVHIGDSKIFLLRLNDFVQLTKDHSLVGKLLRIGLMTPEQARIHPYKHIILKALGERPIMPADFYSGRIKKNDVFCLTTDGILEHITSNELNVFLREDYSESGLKKIIKKSNELGGYDNMTIMTVGINSIK